MWGILALVAIPIVALNFLVALLFYMKGKVNQALEEMDKDEEDCPELYSFSSISLNPIGSQGFDNSKIFRGKR